MSDSNSSTATAVPMSNPVTLFENLASATAEMSIANGGGVMGAAVRAANFLEPVSAAKDFPHSNPSSPREFLNLNPAMSNLFDPMSGYGQSEFAYGAMAAAAAAAAYTPWGMAPTTPWWPPAGNNWLSDAARAFSSHPPASASLPTINPQTPPQQRTSPPTTNQQLSQLAVPTTTANSYNGYLSPNFSSILQNSSAIPMSSLTSTASMINSTSNVRLSELSANTEQTVGGGRIRTAAVGKSPRYSATAAAPSATSSRTQTRNCECSNCADLARCGIPLDRKNEKHNCNIPGCHKVYAKASHLKAHLRWHQPSRPTVHQQNRQNGELSQMAG